MKFSAAIALASVAYAAETMTQQGGDYYEDPFMVDPYMQDPYMQDPYMQDPYMQDPYMQDPYMEGPDIHYDPQPDPVYTEAPEGYWEYPNYVAPDYATEWSDGSLPGPDFNKQCYEFDTCNQIWDQDEYANKVEVEAKLLVSIEALKEAIQLLKLNMAAAEQNIMDNNMSIRINQRNIYANMDAIITSIPISQARVGVLQGRAHAAQMAIDEDLAALVLYCQQFAWAPEMVAPCAEILVCGGRQLPYRTMFPVVEYVEEYYPEDHYPEDGYMEQPY